MTEERNFLMKESVPYLRDYCKERCLDFQVRLETTTLLHLHTAWIFTWETSVRLINKLHVDKVQKMFVCFVSIVL